MGKYYAHSRGNNPDKTTWQRLDDHLRQTALLASEFAATWNAADWGYVAGLWHDIGKYSTDFQARIDATGGADAHVETSARVDHSTAGAQHAFGVFNEKGFGKAIAYTLAGHHGGLSDGISTDSCLRSRLEKEIPDYSACPQAILKANSLSLPLDLDSRKAGIQISMFIRMLYSSLVDADFLDTERFLDKDKARWRQGYPSLKQLEPAFFERLSTLRSKATYSPVNEQRQKVLQQCLDKTSSAMGIFSLTVPTGGGKTLSSMAFALKHAKTHDLKRVIYVIPFTSIIEQNVDVFRRMLGEDAVLEHHSNFEPGNEDHRSRLAAENWDAPVVVTTNVQFFESLFANRSSRCRKLHNIAESVVILDEVQTLPAEYLLPCIEALRELAATYRTTIVLCSATQPAIHKRTDFTRGLAGVTEIIDDPKELSESLKRTRVTVLSQLPDADLADKLVCQEQVLCIVNTRKHARDLHSAISDTEGLFHLSALMCPVHRSQKLKAIGQRLGRDQVCRVISTQLIEAGVDIDFPVVYRAATGIDSIAQAAGRCNREGRYEEGEVFVFTPETGIPAGHFRQTAQAAESVIRDHAEDVLSLEAIEQYFKLYYWTKGDALDENGILTMLHAGCQNGDFPFKTVAEKFKFIKNIMKPVVIPFDDKARSLIGASEHTEFPAIFSRRLQKYTVSVYPWQWESLRQAGSIELKCNLFPVLVDERLYRSDIGLCADNPTQREPEELYI